MRSTLPAAWSLCLACPSWLRERPSRHPPSGIPATCDDAIPVQGPAPSTPILLLSNEGAVGACLEGSRRRNMPGASCKTVLEFTLRPTRFLQPTSARIRFLRAESGERPGMQSHVRSPVSREHSRVPTPAKQQQTGAVLSSAWRSVPASGPTPVHAEEHSQETARKRQSSPAGR